MHQELKTLGLACSKNTVARLMKIHGMRARSARKFRANTTDSKHDLPIAKNVLNRNFKVQNLNQVWLTDFTYIPLKEGFSYLCTIMDLCSRKIIGWATSQNIDTKLALDALHQAVTFRAPKPGLILHSDRGSQYASRAFREQLEKCKIQQSMSRKGNCYDNAPMESFFRSFKVEEVYNNKYETHEQATRAVIDYIDRFYNPVRKHSSLGYTHPIEFERQLETDS
jgi:putative transposase